MSDLRIGVPEDLLQLPPHGGHGKVWSRVLDGLRERAKVVPLRGRVGRKPDVVLASGHAPLPSTRGVPLVVQVHEAGWFEPGVRELLDPAFLADIEHHTEQAVRVAARVVTPSKVVADDVARATAWTAPACMACTTASTRSSRRTRRPPRRSRAPT